MLAPAVLGPEERKPRARSRSGLTGADSGYGRAPRRQAERAVERLFRHGAQGELPLYRPGRMRAPLLKVASRRDPRLRSPARDRRRDLGGLLPLHQGRRRRGRADGDDVRQARAGKRRADPGARLARGRRRPSADVRDGWKAVRRRRSSTPRSRSCYSPGARSTWTPAWPRSLTPPCPSSRAARAQVQPSERVSGPSGRRPGRARRRRGARRSPPRGRMVGGRRDARHRRRLPLVRERESLRAAQLQPHGTARDRHGRWNRRADPSAVRGRAVAGQVPSWEAIARSSRSASSGPQSRFSFYRLLKHYGAARASLVILCPRSPWSTECSSSTRRSRSTQRSGSSSSSPASHSVGRGRASAPALPPPGRDGGRGRDPARLSTVLEGRGFTCEGPPRGRGVHGRRGGAR